MLCVSACGDESENNDSNILLDPLPTPAVEESQNEEMSSDSPSNTTDGDEVGAGTDLETDDDLVSDEVDDMVSDVEDAEDADDTAPTVDRGQAELFGDAFTEGVNFVQLDNLMADPNGYATSVDPEHFIRDHRSSRMGARYADQRIQTEGVIRGVCQRRGCWMSLRSEDDPSGENIDVRFLDYGFFVPLDARGAFARVEGILHRDKIRTLSVEEVQARLASGYNPGIIQDDGTALLIEFTATGVLMWNRTDD